jgi:hypothetical protein
MSDGMLEYEKKVGALTEEYIFFLFFHRGLGNIVAGGVIFLIYVVNWLMGPTILAAILTTSLSICWVFCNNILLRKYYSKFGKMSEPEVPPVRHHQIGSKISFVSKAADWLLVILFCYWRIAFIASLASVAIAWLVLCIADGSITQPSTWLAGLILSVLLMIFWRYLRSPMDFVVGYLLVSICVASGEGLLGRTIYAATPFFLLFSLLLICYGALEQRNFRWLAKQFAEV